MQTSGDLNAILNQLLNDDKAMRLLLLALLREKSTEKLNAYLEETEARTELGINNAPDKDSKEAIRKAGDTAKNIIQILITEKSASL